MLSDIVILIKTVAIAFQRIEPKIALNEAAGITSAAVWIVPYDETDELSLRGSYGGSTHEIYATYSPGRLNVSRVEGSTSPIQWAEILQNVAYKFSDYLKPCSRYRNSYRRTFYFQVIDAEGRSSNIFEKGLTIETGLNTSAFISAGGLIFFIDSFSSVQQCQHCPNITEPKAGCQWKQCEVDWSSSIRIC